MAAFCPACGQPLAPGMKFCGHCGAATGAADLNVPLPQPPLVGGHWCPGAKLAAAEHFA